MPSLTPSDVLARMTDNPRSVFAARDFEAAHLALLRPFAAFRPEPAAGDAVHCPTRSGAGCIRVLDIIHGQLMAICPCDAHEAPLPAESLDLTTFSIDPGRLADALADTFGASGPKAPVGDRCWYLGAVTLDEQRIALILGLFDDRDALRELRACRAPCPRRSTKSSV